MPRSARDQVLAIPELLEHILLFVATPATSSRPLQIEALKSIYRCQRVSRNFLTLTRESWKLKRLMFIPPSLKDLPCYHDTVCTTNPLLYSSGLEMPGFDIQFEGLTHWADGKHTMFCTVGARAVVPRPADSQRLRNHPAASWRHMLCERRRTEVPCGTDGLELRKMPDSRLRVEIEPLMWGETGGDEVTFYWDADKPLGRLVDFIALVYARYMSGKGDSGKVEIDGIPVFSAAYNF